MQYKAILILFLIQMKQNPLITINFTIRALKNLKCKHTRFNGITLGLNTNLMCICNAGHPQVPVFGPLGFQGRNNYYMSLCPCWPASDSGQVARAGRPICTLMRGGMFGAFWLTPFCQNELDYHCLRASRSLFDRF